MTKKQKVMAEEHGTPAQFKKAVRRACDDLFITDQEARDAISKYEADWANAR